MRQIAFEQDNGQTHVSKLDVYKGDYVVAARTYRPRTIMSANWVRLKQITAIHLEITVEAERLSMHKTMVVSAEFSFQKLAGYA